MSYDVMKITDDNGLHLYEVWCLTDGSMAYMTRKHCEEFFTQFDEQFVQKATTDDIIGEFPYPNKDWWYTDEEVNDRDEWYMPECPNCTSHEVVDHRSPDEKKIKAETHWYCRECKSDFETEYGKEAKGVDEE